MAVEGPVSDTASVVSALSLDGSRGSAGTVAGGSRSEIVLGASTADQVLERWRIFLRSSANDLRERACAWDGETQPPPQPTITVSNAVETSSESQDVSPPALRTALRTSVPGRVVASLVAARAEVRRCEAEGGELAQAIAYFGEAQLQDASDSYDTQTPAALLLEMADFLPVLERGLHLLDRIAEVAAHLVRQLVGLYGGASGASRSTVREDGRAQLAALGKRVLPSVLDALGALLTVPATLDAQLLDNARLQRAHSSYTWVVTKAAESGPVPGIEASTTALAESGANEPMAELRSRLKQAEPLIGGDAFGLCTARMAAFLRDVAAAVGEAPARNLREQLLSYFRSKVEESEHVGSAARARLELPAESVMPWVCVFCALLAACWGNSPSRSETRLLADVWKAHKRSPMVALRGGRVTFCLGEFLQRRLPPSAVTAAGLSAEITELDTLRRRQATRLDDGTFAQEMHKHHVRVQAWLAGLDATGRAVQSSGMSAALKEAHLTFVRCLIHALQIRALLESFLLFHVQQGAPVPRSCLHAVSLGFQLLKVLESAPSTARWAEIAVLVQQQLALQCHTALQDASQNAGRRGREGTVLPSVELAISALHGAVASASPGLRTWHFDVGVFSLHCAGQAHQLLGPSAGGCWRELQMMCDWREHLARLCDTSWCYWFRDLLPELLRDLCGRPGAAGRLPWLCSAFTSPLRGPLSLDPDSGGGTGAWRQGPSKALHLAYLDEVRRALESGVLRPLCRTLEEDLRLRSHAAMQQHHQPFGADTLQASAQPLPKAALAEALGLLALRPLRLAPGEFLDLRDEVECQLSKTFHDLSALSPNQSEAYARMRVMASERYSVNIADMRLPGGSLDSGLDVLDIMRKVHAFAAQYGYSMHQQLFVQAANQGSAKVLTITLEHLADSVQMHGAGVIDTTVHYTYGLLRRKLEVVAEFLADESVKSRLLADQLWVEEQRANGKGYSWARALETAKFIRRLGRAKDGINFLEKVRQVVTQIGNSLGYVRMVRSAGIRCLSECLPYAQAPGAPSPPAVSGVSSNVQSSGDGAGGTTTSGDEQEAALPRPVLLSDLAADSGCGQLMTQAAAIADEALLGALRRCEPGAQHLALLAQVFARALAQLSGGLDGVRLPQLFYLLVPAMSLSFVDSLLAGRDALAKRAASTSGNTLRSNAVCFDDGFAMGVACLLRVFGQEGDFRALHWFNDHTQQAAATKGSDAASAAAAAAAEINDAHRGTIWREMSRLEATLEAATSLFHAT